MSHIDLSPNNIPEGEDTVISPPDVIREGLQSLTPHKDIHPVETIQKTYLQNQFATRNELARHLYGQHFVDGLYHEQMAIARLHSTGLGSTLHAVEISMNLHNTIQPEDFMSRPIHQSKSINAHSHMENKYNTLSL